MGLVERCVQAGGSIFSLFFLPNIDICEPEMMGGGEGGWGGGEMRERQPSGVCGSHIGEAICCLRGERRRVTLGFLTGSEWQRWQISE